MDQVRQLRSAPSARRADAAARVDELTIVAERTAPRRARHWVLGVIADAGVGGATNQVVELLTGEIVANALVHGPDGGTVRVRAAVYDDHVRVEADDESPALPRVLHPDVAAPHGRGMAIVEALASAWGVEPHEGGKTVWFTVTRD